MPIEDATAHWAESLSQYQEVARLTLPAQEAWDRAKDAYFEDLSFDPHHTLAAHRPMGSINRARLAVYPAMSARRHSENNRPEVVPSVYVARFLSLSELALCAAYRGGAPPLCYNPATVKTCRNAPKSPDLRRIRAGRGLPGAASAGQGVRGVGHDARPAGAACTNLHRLGIFRSAFA